MPVRKTLPEGLSAVNRDTVVSHSSETAVKDARTRVRVISAGRWHMGKPTGATGQLCVLGGFDQEQLARTSV